MFSPENRSSRGRPIVSVSARIWAAAIRAARPGAIGSGGGVDWPAERRLKLALRGRSGGFKLSTSPNQGTYRPTITIMNANSPPDFHFEAKAQYHGRGSTDNSGGRKAFLAALGTGG